MAILSAYIDFWKKSFDVKSRTSRSDYLWVTGLNGFLLLILYALNFQSFQSQILSSYETGGISSFFPLPSWYYAICLIFVVLGWSITVRRLNDVDEPFGKFVQVVGHIQILEAGNAMFSMHIVEPAFNSLDGFDPTA